jgi:hypothetical protein
MRRYLALAALAAPLVVVGCTRTPEEAEIARTQDQVCTDTVASQIGQPADTLIGIREGSTPAGEAIFVVRTPEVTYRCTIDDRLNVVNITGEPVRS